MIHSIGNRVEQQPGQQNPYAYDLVFHYCLNHLKDDLCNWSGLTPNEMEDFVRKSAKACKQPLFDGEVVSMAHELLKSSSPLSS